MSLPLGFEEVHLDQISLKSCSFEGFKDGNKELALIAAPADFDIERLKGQAFVLNGSKILENDTKETSEEFFTWKTFLNNLEQSPKDFLYKLWSHSGDTRIIVQDEKLDFEEDILKWEVHASEAKSDKHINLLLPSINEKCHKIASQVDINVNVVQSVKVPAINYPENSTEIIQLPKPDYLRVRWKPFGAGAPMKNQSKSRHKNSPQKSQKHSFIQLTEVKDDHAKKKKKKKKKIKEKFNRNNENVNSDPDENENSVTKDESSSTKHRSNKKAQSGAGNSVKNKTDRKDRKSNSVRETETVKSKKTSSVISNGNKVENKHSESLRKKKKPKKSAEKDSDIDSETENKIFGLNNNKNNNNVGKNDTVDKVRRKRKHSSRDDDEQSVKRPKGRMPSPELTKIEVKKKKKKKSKERSAS